jgi:tetratricopeptide (TPR) repeat protein/2-polyprenyl-3-methyl-5-hydroxy-6-metoxy-1,4-benzoquinol methylase
MLSYRPHYASRIDVLTSSRPRINNLTHQIIPHVYWDWSTPFYRILCIVIRQNWLETLPDARSSSILAMTKQPHELTKACQSHRSSAVALIDKGNALEEQGRIAEAMARYDAAVEADPQCARAHLNRGNILLADAQFDEARSAYQRAIDRDPQYAGAHFNLGNLNCRVGDFERALNNYQSAVSIKPDFVDALVALANALDSLGRTAEAVENYERVLIVNPGYAEVHFNLGLMATAKGRHDEAANCLRKAIDIRPEYASAHYYLGVALFNVGRSDQALESLRQAVRLEPTMDQAHYILGFILQNLGSIPQLGEAAASLRRAVEINPALAQAHHILGLVLNRLEQLEAAEASLRHALSLNPKSADILSDLVVVLLSANKALEGIQLIADTLDDRVPTWKIKVAFVSCISASTSITNDPKIRAALTTAITEPWGNPFELGRPALGLIMLNRSISRCVHIANRSWPARLPKSVLFGVDGLAALGVDPLLRALLEAVPVTTIEFERFLTSARHALLETASGPESQAPSDIAALEFYASLARQCFINEYIFDCDVRERLAAAACRTKLLELLDADAAIPPFLLLAVAAYFPLYTLRDIARLLEANVPSGIHGVLRQQIREPLEEQALRAGVECLTSIAGGVSKEVRDQYEVNPYPRWVKLPMPDQILRFNDEFRRSMPFAPFTPMPDDRAPEVLIAGCGTGSHSILVTKQYHGVRVLAIDLSLSSISYAVRKTQELGITSVKYAQADILRLDDLARSFDIVESIGVLHHLAEPFIGWRILLSRLRPGGFMHLGFYSELARKHVVKAREFIAAHGYASTPEDIRRFRRDLTMQVANAELQWLGEISDFYSTSECRDLLFHVQEHRLTLGQIESFLEEFGLQFIGFELASTVLYQYRARFTDDTSATNLRNWACFEADNPNTFIGMYRFWIQKPIGH